jgi:excisionase family DNA binding protein
MGMLTVREVAERLRASEKTVRRWLKEGKLRGVRPGGTRLGWRIPEEEVARLLDKPDR